MKVLSVCQPWAWLIIYAAKDIENRTWHTKFRGRFLVHASKRMTRQDYANVVEFLAAGPLQLRGVSLPAYEELQRGGIIGSVAVVDSIDHSASPWYMGQKGFVLQDPVPLPFYPLKGQLQFFDAPDSVDEWLRALGLHDAICPSHAAGNGSSVGSAARPG